MTSPQPPSRTDARDSSWAWTVVTREDFVPTLEQLLTVDLETLRASIRSIPPDEEPERRAAAQLILAAALRLRVQRVQAGARAQLYSEIVHLYERAFAVYCQAMPWPENANVTLPSTYTRVTWSAAGGDASTEESVGLVLEAARSPLGADSDLLERAARQFYYRSSERAREVDFHEWMLSTSNLGCALALLGMHEGGDRGAAHLEQAVDAFRLVLKEPAAREFPTEYASVHVNIAEALQALAQLGLPGERARYLEGAVGAMVVALAVAAPEKCRGLVELPGIVVT